MDLYIYIIILVIILLLVYIGITYNSLTKLKNLVNEAFSTMDVYLKKRWDLIPNLVETVKGYSKHEKDTLNSIIELRNASYDNMNNNDKVNLNDKISVNITKIMALAESYPELKASENFINLSKELSQVEDEIANSRKYYNGCVRKQNNKIEMFPSNIVASLFRFKKSIMFEANKDEKENIKVDL